MRGDNVFLDTNIIVYAYDNSDVQKKAQAVDIMETLWESGHGIISIQVLQEFFVNVTKKIPHPLDMKAAKVIIKDLLKWTVVVNNGDSILEAIEICQKYKYSFRDSLIVASAMLGGANLLLSEDFSHGRAINGISIINPFISVK